MADERSEEQQRHDAQFVTLGEVYRAVLRVERQCSQINDTVGDHEARLAVLEDRTTDPVIEKRLGRKGAAIGAGVAAAAAIVELARHLFTNK